MADPPGGGPVPEKRRYNVWLLVGAVVAASLIFAAVHWAGSPEQPELSVARQWNDAIQKLGFEPVYPPVEDIQVGDVLAVIAEDALTDSLAQPFAKVSIKLLHLDMTKEIEDAYRELYQFPGTIARPEHEGQIWPQSSSTESLFKPPATRTSLPLVLFPRFTVTSAKHAGGSAGAMSGLLNGVFGAEASSSGTVEVRFSATETYGVPAVPAELRLIDFCGASATKVFCSDQGLRQQLSILVGGQIDDTVKDRKTGLQRSRFSVELALVNRVFLARSIQTSIREDGATRGSGGLNREVTLPTTAAPPDSASGGSSAEPDKSQHAKPASGGTKAPGGALGFEQSAASSVLLPDTLLPRPIVVGFKSVRFKPEER